MTVLLRLAAGFASLLSFPALAQENGSTECAPVVRALQALGAAHQYHWTMSATTPARRRPLEHEEIVLDDDVYLTPENGRWAKTHLTLQQRTARMADELARDPIVDCQLVGNEVKDGIATQVYTYRQGSASTQASPDASPKEGADRPGLKHIWIGAEDGRPHFFSSSEGPVSVSMHVEYDHVQNPLP
jgi:hypothetical protein